MDIRCVATGEVTGYLNVGLRGVSASAVDEFSDGAPLRSWIAVFEGGLSPYVYVQSVDTSGASSGSRAFVRTERWQVVCMRWAPTPEAMQLVIELTPRSFRVVSLPWDDDSRGAVRECGESEVPTTLPEDGVDASALPADAPPAA